MKTNHGRPLHVWQLDFSAYNGTGKVLSYLRAGFEIESEWPPCTNWSGPSGSYSKPVLWAGSFQLLQKPRGMEPGEVVRDTVFCWRFMNISRCTRDGVSNLGWRNQGKEN